MNIPMCVVCGEPAAFPSAVKEPYTCLTCQRSEQPESAAAEKPKAVSSSELVGLRRMLEKRKTQHKASNACEMPRTCGACHFYSGYIQALTDIIERNLPAIKRQQPNAELSESAREKSKP